MQSVHSSLEMTCFKECDDENVDDFDGCTSECKVETGYYCSGEPSVCATRCLLAAARGSWQESHAWLQ